MSDNDQKPPAEERKEEEEEEAESSSPPIDLLGENTMGTGTGPNLGLTQDDASEEPPLTASMRAYSSNEAKSDAEAKRDAKNGARAQRVPFGLEEARDSDDDDAPNPYTLPGAVSVRPGTEPSAEDSIQSKIRATVQSENLNASMQQSSLQSSILSNDHEADGDIEPPNPFQALDGRGSGDTDESLSMRKVPPPRGPATEPGMKRDSSKTMSSAGGEEDAGSGRTIPQDSHQSPSSRARTDHGVAPSHGDYTDGTVLTDDAVVETEVPIAMPVNPDDDEENRAEEAQQQVIYHPAIEVHPKDDELPHPTRWKRNVVISVAALSVCVIIAAVVGGVMASKNNDKGTRTIGIPPDPPTLAPTRPPAPLNCTIENLGPVYAADHCPWCDFGVARDGDTVILVTSDSWSEDGPDMEVIVGPFRLASNMPDHPITEMAFSEDSFVASDPLDWDGGVVYITSKGPSGELLDDTIKLRPAPENVDPLGQFGTTIAVDGDVLVVGAPNDDNLAGSAFIFRRNADDRSKWDEEAKFKPPDFGVQNFGNSVLVKNDGNFVVVAADYYGDENKGAVFFYKFDDESNLWKNFTALVNDECDGNFGSSLAFSGDDGLLIGCPMYNDAIGAVYYYQRSDKDDGSWQYKEIQRITAKDGEKLDKFGGNSQHLPMSLNEEFVLIGTYDEECGVDESLYLFSKFDNAWLEVAQINGPEDSTYFGGKSVIAGDRVLISSWENTYSYKMKCKEDREQVNHEEEQKTAIFK